MRTMTTNARSAIPRTRDLRLRRLLFGLPRRGLFEEGYDGRTASRRASISSRSRLRRILSRRLKGPPPIQVLLQHGGCRQVIYSLPASPFAPPAAATPAGPPALSRARRGPG